MKIINSSKKQLPSRISSLICSWSFNPKLLVNQFFFNSFCSPSLFYRFGDIKAEASLQKNFLLDLKNFLTISSFSFPCTERIICSTVIFIYSEYFIEQKYLLNSNYFQHNNIFFRPFKKQCRRRLIVIVDYKLL